MIHGKRLILMATLPIALMGAGCEGKSGLSRAKPDAGSQVRGTPDTAVPGNPNPDTALSSNPNPDSLVPRNPRLDSAPPFRPADAAMVDTVPMSPDTRPPKDVLIADIPVPMGTAIINVTPPLVDFGAMDVGGPASRVVVTVANSGSVASAPLGVVVTGTGLSVTGCGGLSLEPRASCLLTITAMPATAGPISGTIEVGDSPANSKKIAITGLAVIPGQMLSLAPAPLDLGSVLTGKSVTGTIVLTNNTAVDASGIIINVSGTGFRALSGGTCTDTLAAGQSCKIEVSFTAGATSGSAKGTVTVSVAGRTSQVAMTATVLAPAKLLMTPLSVAFAATVGTPSMPVTFYVTNAGDMSSTIPTVTIAGTSKDDFSFTTTCATALPGGATDSCKITVVFTPKGAAGTSSSATLTVAESGSGGSSVTAMLTGTVASQDPPANPIDRIPVDNTVSGWMVDPESNVNGTKKPMTATTKEEGGLLIDGGIEPFYAVGFSPKLFIWQNYKNSQLPAAPVGSDRPKGAILSLYVFQVPSADQASGLYQNLLKHWIYQQSAWEDPTTPLVGAKSRIVDTNTRWWINFQKGEFYVEIELDPSYGPAPDYVPGNLDLKNEALRFAQALAQRL